MLGLVSHEPKFMLLREKMSVVMAGRGRRRGDRRKPKSMLEYGREDFELLELSILKEMFDVQFRKFGKHELDFAIENDRIIDDFIFFCMLVGNDFLPHSPHLSIDSGALSLMLNVYTDLLPKMGGYLTKGEKIHPQRFQAFMDLLMTHEKAYFESRAVEEGEKRWAQDNYDEYYYKTKLNLSPDDPEGRSLTIHNLLRSILAKSTNQVIARLAPKKISDLQTPSNCSRLHGGPPLGPELLPARLQVVELVLPAPLCPRFHGPLRPSRVL